MMDIRSSKKRLNANGENTQINFRKEATSHIFRHTYISMLTETGVDLKTIIQRVGHDDPEPTLRIYTHVIEKMRKDTNEEIRIHFSDILNFNFQEINVDPEVELQEM